MYERAALKICHWMVQDKMCIYLSCSFLTLESQLVRWENLHILFTTMNFYGSCTLKGFLNDNIWLINII